jgi:hypothetical protein
LSVSSGSQLFAGLSYDNFGMVAAICVTVDRRTCLCQRLDRPRNFDAGAEIEPNGNKLRSIVAKPRGAKLGRRSKMLPARLTPAISGQSGSRWEDV